MKNPSNTLKNHFILILGFIMFALFIYFRFIRERLPREIPFNLTTLGFIILMEICCIYGYILLTTIKPPKNQNEIIQNLISLVYEPLNNMDSFIKDLPGIRSYYPKFIYKLAYIFEKLNFYIVFDILFFIIPRGILVFTFILDIFIWGKLYYIYKVIFLGIFLFLRRYILYSIKKYKNKLTLELKEDINSIWADYEYGVHPNEWPENVAFEEDDEDDDYNTREMMILSFDIFVDYYCKNKVYNNKECSLIQVVMTSTCEQRYQNAFTIKGSSFTINTGSEDYKNKEIKTKELTSLFKQLLKLYVMEESYNNNIYKNMFLKLMKISIYSLYFIGWFYILYVSCSLNNIIDVINIIELVQPITLNDNELSEIFIP